MKLKLNKTAYKEIASAAVMVIAAVLFFVFTSPSVSERKAEKTPAEPREIVTRFPLAGTGILTGKKPDSAIFLSWYDNSVRLSPDKAIVERLGAVLYPVTIPDRTLDYSVSDKNIAEIDSDGNILAKKPGSVEITVKNDSSSTSSRAFLNIVQPVTGMYLEQSTINLYTTDMSKRIAAIVVPDNASNAAVRWYSKDDDIVEVDQTGHLKPKKTGMTEVVATSSDGNYKSKCFVNVINEVIRATAVSIINKAGVKLKEGDTWMGMASVTPANAKNTHVEWSTSNDKIATVTKTGLVKAIAPGSVVITARNADGPSDTVTIEVAEAQKQVTAPVREIYEGEGGVRYVPYAMTLDEMTDITLATGPTYNDGSGNRAAGRERLMEYIDPNEFCSGTYKYQFMDLSHYNGISRDVLNAFLEGKGILSGQADAFIEAAREYNVSELYLVAHACVETGYGSSRLACGVPVNGTTVYNMYGIGAYDYDAVGTGSQRAYSEGWTSPAKAIKDGGRWISEHYINIPGQRQNTLYKMRWNPDAPGTHLYAGDITWAVMQSVIMERLFSQFPEASIAYEVPVYAGSPAAPVQ
ncbi:MAG: Ig-like domain-containing protein [Clostridia bacterium]|nr:Ig-like domain-containing protein [Clostridia bacterium]